MQGYWDICDLTVSLDMSKIVCNNITEVAEDMDDKNSQRQASKLSQPKRRRNMSEDGSYAAPTAVLAAGIYVRFNS